MLEKIIELKNKGFSDEDVIKNIFLNYSSKYENDSIYLIKKELSEFLNVEINCIKLIGSAHSGIGKTREGKIVSKKNPNDLDFTVIDAHCFDRELKNILLNEEIISRNMKNFGFNIMNGKIHLKYVSKENRIVEFCNKIDTGSLNNKKISICIYLSEFYFIKSLKKFLSDPLLEYLREYIKEDVKKINDGEIKQLGSFK